MSKPNQSDYELGDAGKRNLVQLIQAGKAQPEKYRFVLFEDKREVELVWNGKTADACTTVLPFQTLEHIDEPREETRSHEDLFDSRGRPFKGWTDTCDCPGRYTVAVKMIDIFANDTMTLVPANVG